MRMRQTKVEWPDNAGEYCMEMNLDLNFAEQVTQVMRKSVKKLLMRVEALH